MGNKVVKNVAIIMACSVIAKVLSYVWEAMLAAYLGASDQADALYMTTSITNILYPILDLGIWKVFLPIYKTKMVKESEEAANRVANIAITFFVLASVALVLFLVVFSKPITIIMAPGFSPEKKALTIQYLCISAPTYLLMASSSVIGAILQSHDRFLGSQIRELGTHVSKIIYILICYRFMGIYAAITAMIIGSIFRLIVQIPFIDWNWKFRFDFHFKDKDIVPMLKGLPSVALTAAISQINEMVDKMIASGTVTGAIACLNYGQRLMSVFSGMISTAIGTATYPTMIQYIAKDEVPELKKLLNNVIGAIAFFTIPISFFCFAFSEEIVAVAFQRGAFDSSATQLTSAVFLGYCVGMFFVGTTTIITNVFYAYGDTKITLAVSVLNIILNIILDVLFVKTWGVAGVAVATSVAAIICLFVRLRLLRRFIQLEYKGVLVEIAKIIIASIISVGCSYWLCSQVLSFNVYITVFLGMGIIAILFLPLSKLLKLQTTAFVFAIIKKRMKR